MIHSASIIGILTALSYAFKLLVFSGKWLYVKYCLKYKPSKVFNIEPMNLQGENIFFKRRDAASPRETELWKLKLHFKVQLRLLKSAEIQNIDLTYAVKGFPGEKQIKIDQRKCKIDSSYQILSPYKLNKNKTESIIVSQEFNIPYSEADNKDHDKTYVVFTMTSYHWTGARKYLLTGKLEPGGKFISYNFKLIKPAVARKSFCKFNLA